MIHDIARSWSAEQLFDYMRRHGLPISPAEQQTPVLLHARIGGELARRQFGVDDPDILRAIERHTVAVPGMTDLEKIVYIADAIEPSRSFPQRAEAAAAADRSLDEGFLACIRASMDHLARTGIAIAPPTLTVYNELERRCEA